ncbi:MAG: hypothetical protein ACXVB9_02075 [Bdellovibrionota bacterium]
MKHAKKTFFLLSLALFSCQAKKAGSSSTDTATSSGASTVSTDPSTGTSTGTTGDPTTIAVIPTSLGARNFDQMNATMESVTGVTGNATVISRFNSLKAQLPSSNDIKAFSFSSQGAITVLAAEYCTALITNSGGKYATQLASVIGNFNITAIPTVAFAGTAPTTLAQMMIVKFWGSGYASSKNAAPSAASVVQLMSDLTTGQANTATTTKNSVIGACTSVLASAPVSTY